MAAYSVIRLDPEPSVLRTVRSRASSPQTNLEHFLREAVYNILSWVRCNDDRDIEDFVNEIDHLFVQLITDTNVQIYAQYKALRC
jgi:hypothetical protein